MKEQEKALLKEQINKAKLISFDIFDTLLFRKTNTPEAIFDLVGKHFGIHGFRKLRMDEQNEASRRAYEAHQAPHANMDEIYEVLSEHTEIAVDWNEVKEFEIQMERDALVANQEMLEIVQYAKSIGKRVIATSDMYLFAETLEGFLKEKGFKGIEHVYCSADEQKAKFNKDLFEVVAQKEDIAYEDILHIGDKDRDDGEFPASYGYQTFVYHRDFNPDKLKHAPCSEVDNGLYKILFSRKKDFWYNLGVEVGGPIYMGLYRFIRERVPDKTQKIYLIARDGYNLYHILKVFGYTNIEYLYTSRRALTMACITEMNEREIASLPPYIMGQTVGEILEYLGIKKEEIHHLKTVGFHSFDDEIRTLEDIEAFKLLYECDREVFLAQCEKEREYALAYFHKIGFFEQDSICFDCGWQGSSQELLERFKKTVNQSVQNPFIYFGIKNSDKSREQLHGLHYDTYLFDFYKNYALQDDIDWNVVLYELFFSAPHESVYRYDVEGTVLFEHGKGDCKKAELLEGILDFMNLGVSFVEKYDVEYSPELAVGHLKRLIHFPTEEEAVTIGNMSNVDGFARKSGDEAYIAHVTLEELKNNPGKMIYWPKGLFKRPDISEEVKREFSKRCKIPYPAIPTDCHLEDEGTIRTYYRWREHQRKRKQRKAEFMYTPRFSVVIPVYNTVTEQLEECIQSVLNQTYEQFELILVDDHSSWENVVPVLKKYEQNEHVKVIYRTVNGHISEATNDGIRIASGDYIVFMDCDDVIETNALEEFAIKLNENTELDFIYSDEDKVTEDGKIYHMPFFKPEWSPDLFMNMMYTNHLATYRTSIVKEVGGLRTAYNGSQDYDFTLRFMEKSDNKCVGHIPKVLYHWRERKESVAYAMSSKNYASEAARYAKEDYIRRNQIKAHLEPIFGMSQYRTIYEVIGEPLVSIVIPSKDHPEILIQCIDSIRAFTNYPNYEIIVVDNGSSPGNQSKIIKYLNSTGAKYLYEREEFNFSKMCNKGAAHATGEYLLFLNNDIEMFQPDWLERMLGHAQQAHTGAVGAKLFYPKTTILQHTGVSNPSEGPLHSFLGGFDQIPYYFGMNRVDYNCIAVTGACLLLQKDKFNEVGGFDESLPVAYNDVKLCFALHEKGYYNVVRNDVAAYHHESLSRGSDHADEKKLIRMNRERMRLMAEFPDLNGRDPYLNENLRHYTGFLDLKQYYNCLEEYELPAYQDAGRAEIDVCEIGERVRIVGWSLIPNEEHMEELDRYVVFKNPYGNVYRAKALPISRLDVVEVFGSKNYEYAGFECILSKDDLRVDLMLYQMGVLTIDREGNPYFRWCRETYMIKNLKSGLNALGNRSVPTPEPGPNSEEIRWYLDSCEEFGDFYKLRGFAFKKGNVNDRYQKTLILSGIHGESIEFDVHKDERVDVAMAYPAEHFLYYTGFQCWIYKTTLKNGCEYDVYIRLKNRFDSEDIYDIATGHKIKT